MKKLSFLLAIAMVVSFASFASAQQESVTVTMKEQNNSGQTGTATLTAKGNQTEVVINIKGGAAGVAQPAHIHEGQCPTPGAVKYPLTAVVDGKSTTTVNASLKDLQSGKFAVNAHKSAQEASVYVSCGDIPAAPAALPKTGDSNLASLALGAIIFAVLALGSGFILRRQNG